MSIVVFIIFGVAVMPMAILAIFLLNGKGTSLVAGYNTMSRAEQARYDEKALCRFVGRLLLVISVCVMLFPIGIHFEAMWITWIGIVVLVLGTVGAVIYMNTGDRFRKNTGTEVMGAIEKTTSKTAKIAGISVGAISVIILIAVGIMIYHGGKDPVVRILDNQVKIEAMYGLGIDFSEITDVTLIEMSMENIGIGKRTNGYGGISGILKGHFKSDVDGDILLFVDSHSSPTIRIERTDDKPVYISLRDGADTEKLYNTIMMAVR